MTEKLVTRQKWSGEDGAKECIKKMKMPRDTPEEATNEKGENKRGRGDK